MKRSAVYAVCVLHMLVFMICARAVSAEIKPPTIEAVKKAMIERQLWFNNAIGITDKVPPPWKPLEITPKSALACDVAMLERRYEFQGSLFPSLIHTWGQQVLQSPIALKVVLDREHTVSVEGVKFTKRKPGEAEFLAFGKVQGLDICASHHAEYDGMIWTRLTISPRLGPVRVKRISLEIPLRMEAAKYFNHNHFYGELNVSSNIMGKIGKLPFKTPFKPSLWLGNDEVGLCWFAESDQGWDRSKPLDNQVELIDRGGARILRINFIRSPRVLKDSLEFSFGLLATPTKPLKKNWRANPAFAKPTFFDWNWDAGGYYPEPNPKRSDKFAKMLAAPEAYFKTSFNYFGIMLHEGSYAPETYFFSREWERRTVNSHKESLADPPAFAAQSGTKAGSPLGAQADWLLWKWDRLVKKHKIRNVYFDSLGFPDANRLHGAGYVDEHGELQLTYNILAMRKALQRFYVMMWQNAGEFNLMVHGGSSVPPVLSFAHIHLSGEQFIVDPRRVEAHYTEVMPIEEYRGYFMGKQFGVVGMFLPELGKRYRSYREPTEEMVMLVLLHDTVTIAAFCYGGVVTTAQKALAEYGMAETKFIPYWRNSSHVDCANKDVKISLYTHEKDPRRCLLLLGNTSKAHQNLSLVLKMPALAAAGGKARDLLNGETFDINKGRFEIAARKLNYRLIAVTAD